jgi:hypothetical protein
MTSQVPHVWWLSSFAMPSPWSQGATCTWPSADGTSLVAPARRDDVAPRGEDGGAHERALAVGEITSEHLDRDFTAVHIAVGEAEVGVLKGRQGGALGMSISGDREPGAGGRISFLEHVRIVLDPVTFAAVGTVVEA